MLRNTDAGIEAAELYRDPERHFRVVDGFSFKASMSGVAWRRQSARVNRLANTRVAQTKEAVVKNQLVVAGVWR